jgi:hypothetical protein
MEGYDWGCKLDFLSGRLGSVVPDRYADAEESTTGTESATINDGRPCFALALF